jgi:ribulose-phosphate 3-epimerase
MKALTSLWSADPMHVGAAIDEIDAHTDGFHIDVTDGHFARQLLFGPDFVAAVRARTRKTIDVHLMVDDADTWIPIFVEAGADMVTVHRRSTSCLHDTIDHIVSLGASASIAIEIDEALPAQMPPTNLVARHLLMGTAIGIKGAEPISDIDDRVRRTVQHHVDSGAATEVWVDGGIRTHTVPGIAAAGAHGVIPGSLVYGAEDPKAALDWLHSLTPAAPAHRAP